MNKDVFVKHYFENKQYAERKKKMKKDKIDKLIDCFQKKMNNGWFEKKLLKEIKNGRNYYFYRQHGLIFYHKKQNCLFEKNNHQNKRIVDFVNKNNKINHLKINIECYYLKIYPKYHYYGFEIKYKPTLQDIIKTKLPNDCHPMIHIILDYFILFYISKRHHQLLNFEQFDFLIINYVRL